MYPDRYVYLLKNNNATAPGEPDYHFILGGITFYMELKYVASIPNNRDALLLGHPFEPTQYKHGYLITISGAPYAGVVGIEDRAYLPCIDLIKKGNFSYNELISRNDGLFMYSDSIWDVKRMVKLMENRTKLLNSLPLDERKRIYEGTISTPSGATGPKTE